MAGAPFAAGGARSRWRRVGGQVAAEAAAICSQHGAEEVVVNRPDRVPVGEAGDSHRIEDGRLPDRRSTRAVGLDLELEPRPAGHLHLRRETQQPVLLEALDPPEVDLVADPDVDRVAASAPQARPADEHVERATHLPKLVADVPTGVAADSLNRRKRGGRRARHPDAARVDEPRATTETPVASALRRARGPSSGSPRSRCPRRRAPGRPPRPSSAAARGRPRVPVGRGRPSRCAGCRRAHARCPRAPG